MNSARPILTLILALIPLSIGPGAPWAWSTEPIETKPSEIEPVEFVNQYCVHCHATEAAAGLNLAKVSSEPVLANADVWEKVLRKLAVRQMPPVGEPQPNPAELDGLSQRVAKTLDEAYSQAPKLPKTESLRRLTRTEYRNAIRDLLGVQVDVTTLLPPDESSHGFDNITVSNLSPTWLNRAVSAAQKISHLAIGAIDKPISGETIRVRADITQEGHLPGLPLGTRGGALIPTHTARPGLYEVNVRLARDRNEEVEGLYEEHQLEILVDKKSMAQFTVSPPPGRRDFSIVDKHLTTKIPLDSGPHQIGVTFVAKSASLLETKRQPYNAHYNMHRHPRLSPAVYEVSITGPFEAPTSNHASNSSPLCRVAPGQSQEQAAVEQLKQLLRKAYRRTITQDDLAEPLAVYQRHADAGHTIAMEHALASILVSPQFLFKIEKRADDRTGEEATPLDAFELASRLSFFLWSSLPDEELLQLAETGQLSQPEVLQQQVKRMLQDTKADSLIENFAEQWLYLRNLDSVTPDLRMFPDFDDNLRQAFRQESQLCFARILKEDRSVLELLHSDTTFLNERLARHYGIPHIYGSRFRAVQLPGIDGSLAANQPNEAGRTSQLVDISTNISRQRGGLLRQGSILTVTSYATRTSPVLRGHWVLKNILGSPPPPPPADVPTLKDNTVDNQLSMRERLAQHRQQAACAGCHNLLDPVGFALENYDAVGRLRELEDGLPLDTSGSLPGAGDFQGVEGLERALLSRPEPFVATLTEKLMAYALGRGIEPSDGPAVRRIVDQSSQQQYRLSQIIEAIVLSPPFRLRSGL